MHEKKLTLDLVITLLLFKALASPKAMPIKTKPKNSNYNKNFDSWK
jgi:hypothetical protein